MCKGPNHTTLICHRGESHDAPENTLPAYRMAVDRGFGFECDVYLSSDGRCFTFHDRDLARTTGGADTRRCSEVPWEGVVSKLDVGNWGPWKGGPYKGTHPALLEDVLALARDGRWIYLELKSGPEIVPYVAKALEAQTNATSANLLFISFRAEVCAELKRRLPAYRVYLLAFNRALHVGKSFGPAKTAEDVISELRDCKADGVDMEYDPTIHTAEFIRKVHDAGFDFHAWVINDPSVTLAAFERGADSVTTDCAQKQLDEIARGSVVSKR